ncbi:uncharacterized protein DFL_002006 [Arthrobotrys flagrans]|uniref:Uncharacterized protein n=1 Tax=Arthrobotrys flagrans TaxID=97331 RepID=A0A437A9G7_ARTFL|nr:hypothetical protein DFL_002006 [Arthrobotrys flagrans]
MSDKLYQTLVRGVNCKYNSPSAQYDRETRERGSKSPTRRGFRKRGNLSKIQSKLADAALRICISRLESDYLVR